MSYLILGASLLAAFILLGRWFMTADPRTIARAIRYILAAILVIIALYFIVAGLWFLAMPAALGALTMLGLRTQGRPMPFGIGAGPKPGKPGQSSEIRTDHLIMSLDHDTGVMRGTIMAGPLEGKTLDELSRERLFMLHAEWSSADPDSAALLESYFDRRFEESWRTDGTADEAQESRPASSPSGAMDHKEALAILGLDKNASIAEVKAAHRRLITKLHPDQGGTDYLAARINQAKDFLLGT